jgi:hypothetical protein
VNLNDSKQNDDQQQQQHSFNRIPLYLPFPEIGFKPEIIEENKTPIIQLLALLVNNATNINTKLLVYQISRE